MESCFFVVVNAAADADADVDADADAAADAAAADASGTIGGGRYLGFVIVDDE